MFTNRKHIILTTLMLCLMLLATTGCIPINLGDLIDFTNDPSSSSQAETPVSSDVLSEAPSAIPEAEPEDDQSAELTALRQEITNNNCMVGIAFVGYLDSDISDEELAPYLNRNALAAKYPFLSNGKLVSYDGLELFALVPANENSVITLYPAGIDQYGDFTIQRNLTIYKSEPGETVILRCNDNENYANVFATVTDGDSVCEFYPMISLEDGYSVALYEGCYDFSLDDIFKHMSEAYYYLENDIPEIREAINDGMGIIYDSEIFYIDQNMLVFELGQFTEYGFVCEKKYAISFDATYVLDSDNQTWIVIGDGIGN